ncbi:MAG: AIM24 family protein [Chiayiivirga sp.]|jgi:uncharacterized protein (AIM24 family)|uniref:AIM24 family protein n=1 Tax=Chiayiivirga sp. TaxID=2041042 RepID=UPI0025BE3C18|nr:AIM24 family protein [Chiayiivirga sp.]MCI1728698.1 AIM24 family protein [Chiayiivirga sp.]
MHQWFISYNGQQMGPLDHAAAVAQATKNPNGHVWRQGFAEWIPLSACTELSAGSGTALNAPPPPTSRRADEIDYKIYGEDMQFVEIELDPGESAVAEAGSMMYKEATVQMETVFGDGSPRPARAAASWTSCSAPASASSPASRSSPRCSRTPAASGKAKVAFAAPYPGTIVPLHLSNYNGRIICQKDSFLCAARGVSIGIFFQKKVMTALFGGEGFIMQKLEGDGQVFVHAGGTILERQLAPGERLDVDTGCVVALTDTVGFDVKPVGGIKSMIFGGEGVFLATLTGPGHVWMQSLPFSRMAGRMLAAAYRNAAAARAKARCWAAWAASSTATTACDC